MVKLPEIKQGDTFILGCTSKDSNGNPENLANTTIYSQLRMSANNYLLQEFQVIILDQTAYTGQFSIGTPTNTQQNWPVGVHLMDIEFKVANTVTRSETMQLPVIKAITND